MEVQTLKVSVLPIAGLLCVLVAGFSHVSAGVVIVWLIDLAILGYCAGRYMVHRDGEDDPDNRR